MSRSTRRGSESRPRNSLATTKRDEDMRISVLAVAMAWASLASAQTWTVPRTPDGRPDLQGIWTNASITPLERPKDLGTKEWFTEQEAEENRKRALVPAP